MVIADEAKEILTELINTGVGRAAKTLNELLRYEIELDLPRLNIFNFNEMEAQLVRMKTGSYVNVVQEFDGALEGFGILSFPVVNGKTLINTLLDQEEDGESEPAQFSLTEIEAISEVGNNIINSVQGTISDMASMECNYHLPQTVISTCILPIERMKQDEVYLFGEVMFKVSGIDVEGMILLVYAYRNIESLMDKYFDLLGK